jgi:hypothetical protein
MIKPTRCLLVAGLLLVTSGTAEALDRGGYDGGTRVCRFADPRIAESSGLASASFSETALWTHNDSGDTGRFFLVDTPTCRTVASYAISVPPTVQEPDSGESTTNLDIEDMARGRTADGRPMLLVADIGDNQQARPAHVVYELAEPDGHVTDPGVEQPVAPLAIHTFSYPGPAWDAESIAVLPDRRLVIVTKPRSTPDLAYTGHSEVYVSTAPMRDSGLDPLIVTKVADIDFPQLLGTTSGEAIAATSADLTADGRRFVVRTYTTAFEWPVGPAGDLAAAVAQPPVVLPLLPTKQGEGIAYSRDGGALWTSSEGSGTDSNPASGVIDSYRPTAPAPVVPEAPWATLLPLAALACGALLVLRSSTKPRTTAAASGTSSA